MRNLTYTLSPHSPFAALTDPKKGVKGRLTDPVVVRLHFNPTPEAFVDGLICYHSCCQVQLKNLTTRMVANQTINIKRLFWRQVEMRNLTYTLSPHSPFAALTDPQKGVKRAPHGPCRRSGFISPDARSLIYVDGLICYSCCQVQLKNLTTRMVANQTINIKRFLASG